MATIIDGKKIAARLCADVARQAAEFSDQHGMPPALAVILVGEDPASEIYVRRKMIQCRKAGIRSAEYRLPSDASEAILLGLIVSLNRDPTLHGILIQLPLPGHLDAVTILDTIHPAKDVDGFHPVNVGRLSIGGTGLVPCTPLGCMTLLDMVIDDLRGKHAVVIGKSNVVGKPIALMLLERECTVTVTHIATRNLREIVQTADILIAAAGAARLVRGNWVKSGAVVIDVGITQFHGPDGTSRIVGDCATDELDHVAAITPVPGGVGPMTIACLLSNTLQAARMLAYA